MLTDCMLPLQMNYTRLMWGGETDLNCTQHDRDDMPVLLTSFILLTTPLLFYGASCICGERRKLKLLTREPLSLFINQDCQCGLRGIFFSFLFHFNSYLPYVSFKTMCSNPYFSLTSKKTRYLFVKCLYYWGQHFWSSFVFIHSVKIEFILPINNLNQNYLAG